MEIIHTSYNEFKSLNASLLFDEEPYSRVYGFIQNGIGKIAKFSWRSEVVQPIFRQLEEGRSFIGIDNHAVFFNSLTFDVELRLELEFNFYTLTVLENYYAVISELEVVLLNKSNLNPKKKIELPDIFKSISFEKNQLLIMCMDGLKINEKLENLNS